MATVLVRVRFDVIRDPQIIRTIESIRDDGTRSQRTRDLFASQAVETVTPMETYFVAANDFHLFTSSIEELYEDHNVGASK